MERVYVKLQGGKTQSHNTDTPDAEELEAQRQDPIGMQRRGPDPDIITNEADWAELA